MKEIKELKQILLDLPNINNEKSEKECFNLLSGQINRLVEIRKNFSIEEDKKMIKLFRSEMIEIILMSEFIQYVYRRPRGYAGDFMTMEKIYLSCSDTKYRYTGKTDTGKIISALTFDMNACLATTSRIYYLKDEISKAGRRVASIGCGSCIEYWNATHDSNEGTDGFMLDQDSGALESARKHIIQNGNIFDFHNDTILKFILNRDKVKLMGERDLIYSVGMLDYFNVKNSARIVNRLWDAVKSGGLIIITNAHPDNPTRFWMEYAGDWFLCYKNKEEMHEIIAELKDVDSVDYIMDKYNVFQYLKIRKK